MTNIKVFAHDYQSASFKIDDAIALVHRNHGDDKAFRNPVCAIVGEAARILPRPAGVSIRLSQ